MNAARNRRSGFVLVTTVVLLGAAMILVGGALAYISHATRQTAIMTGRSVCRLAAQSAIEACKDDVNSAFLRSIDKSARRVGFSNSNSYDWFENSAGPSLTLGKAPNTVTLPANTNINGCAVRVRFGRVYHETGKSAAEVTIVATAERTNPGGSVSTSTIEERVRFAIARSKVFDNAYFVNNYGWFQGSSVTANGDVRANGDMYLDSGCKVNGNVYAARNPELGVNGDITNYGKMDAYSTYLRTTYGVADMVRPLGTGGGMYDAPNSVSTATYRNRLHPNEELTVEMPFIGDLSDYVEWSEELHAADANQGTIRQGGHTVATCRYSGAGPSGNESNADKGALLLIGTASNPIEVNGPVVVDSDVIIKGYVKGQGTIYSGRNIHIIGNIQYVDPPRWENKAVNSDNSTKDMLGLMAKGNIVLGDCTTSGWLNNIRTYITQTPYVQAYACDASDADIGYPATFGGSYAVLDGGLKVNERTETVTLDTGHYETVYTYDRYGRVTGRRYEWVADTETRTVYSNTANRHYYDTVCANSVIANNASTITRIDAILYNNHGTFGNIGSCTINGSLVCRNEGIRYSGSLFINWDYRLYSGSDEAVDNDAVGLARSSDNPPSTIAWQEVPDSVNQETEAGD